MSDNIQKRLWREALDNERTLPDFQTQGEFLDLIVQASKALGMVAT